MLGPPHTLAGVGLCRRPDRGSRRCSENLDHLLDLLLRGLGVPILPILVGGRRDVEALGDLVDGEPGRGPARANLDNRHQFGFVYPPLRKRPLIRSNGCGIRLRHALVVHFKEPPGDLFRRAAGSILPIAVMFGLAVHQIRHLTMCVAEGQTQFAELCLGDDQRRGRFLFRGGSGGRGRCFLCLPTLESGLLPICLKETELLQFCAQLGPRESLDFPELLLNRRDHHRFAELPPGILLWRDAEQRSHRCLTETAGKPIMLQLAGLDPDHRRCGGLLFAFHFGGRQRGRAVCIDLFHPDVDLVEALFHCLEFIDQSLDPGSELDDCPALLDVFSGDPVCDLLHVTNEV